MIALVGNPNSGKTTLFNYLTNASELVGNYAGITVDKKIGKYKNYEIIDLPGIYSLIPYTNEEIITCQYLKDNDISLIINVIDINSLNRSLYLTSRLMDLNIPMIIVLNKCDHNVSINTNLLSKILDINICLVSVLKKKGINDLDKILNSGKISSNKFYSNNNIFSDIYLRYKQIDIICSKVITKKNSNLSNKVDKILLNKCVSLITNIVLFIFIYFISINIIGSYIVNKLSNTLNIFINYIINYINNLNTSIVFKSLIINGILKGIKSVVTFIPQMIIITLIISLLEDSGYITRISIMMNSALKKIGLSGKCFQSLVMGFNCSVLGIMSTRTIKNKNERLKTIFLIPFIPCSAKVSVIIYITTLFYHNSFLVFLSFYLLCLIVIIISSFTIKSTSNSYLMEVTNLKIPSVSVAINSTLSKIKSYLFRIITIIMFISIINWILISFDWSFNYNVEFRETILYFISNKISFMTKLFVGKNSILESISALNGIIAKEQVVSTMSVIGNNLNIISAYSFCLFNIITIPCINTISIIKKECGIRLMIIYLFLYLLISYTFSTLIYLLLKILF